MSESIKLEHELTDLDRQEYEWHDVTLPGDVTHSYVRGEAKPPAALRRPRPDAKRIDIAIAALGRDCRVEVDGVGIRATSVRIEADAGHLTRVEIRAIQPAGGPYVISGWLVPDAKPVAR